MENEKVVTNKIPAGTTMTWPDRSPDDNRGVDSMKPNVSPGFKQTTDVPNLGQPDQQTQKSSDV